MKLILSILLSVGAGLAAPGYEPVQLDYHRAVGIPAAARIKAAEEATDFDGARITGGNAAFLGQFPFMGGLVISLPLGFTSVCGSSLLSNTRLVTAAHCWIFMQGPAEYFTVVLGSVRLFSGGTRIFTDQVVVHPDYNPDNINNDIAVISIPHVEFTNNISPIGLPPGADSYVGQTATAAGFGITGDGHGISLNQFLSYVDLPVIANAQCEAVFGSRFVISSTLCTWGVPGRNVCSSDSGGPLHIGNTLIGVTSFGSISCESDNPAGYARVTSFASWIRQHM